MSDAAGASAAPPIPRPSPTPSTSSSSLAGPSTTTASPIRRSKPLMKSDSMEGLTNNAAPATSPQRQQVGSRQAMRSRSRTTRKASTSSNQPPSIPGLPRYNSEDHPLSAHKLAARGYHSFSCLGVPFHVQKKYTFLRELGIGAYGCVALCRDEELEMNVAIKKVTRVFERDVLARRALREVAVLRHMLRNQNCTALIDFDTTFVDFSEIYLVLSASEADLSQIIRSGQALSDAHLQYFAAQLLRGVRYMHAANVIHRDLKPGNLLVNADCALFICDFGLARAFAGPSKPSSDRSAEVVKANESPRIDGEEVLLPASPQSPSRTEQEDSSKADIKDNESGGDTEDPVRSPTAVTPEKPSRIRTSRLDFPGGPLTEYVSTRWYRAPEVMLGFREGYGTEIDMWSVGCILAELATGRPLFDGKDYVDQIARINSVLGGPPQAVLDRISSERARVYVESLPKEPSVPLAKVFKSASEGLIDLMEKILVWDPRDRLSAAEALKHPWLSAYHGIIDQWEPPAPFSKFDEIELISSLAEFKNAFQRESQEVKGEYATLFGSEDGSSQAGSTDDREEDESSNNGNSRLSTPSSKHSSRGVDIDGVAGPDRDGPARPSMGGPNTSDSSSGRQISSASSTALSRMRRNGECSPDYYTTDTGTVSSPVTSVGGESASLSSSCDSHSIIHKPSSTGLKPFAAMTPSAGAKTPALTSAMRDAIVLPRPETFESSDETANGAGSSHVSASELRAVAMASAYPANTAGLLKSEFPRYRRRAVSNASRHPPSSYLAEETDKLSLNGQELPKQDGDPSARRLRRPNGYRSASLETLWAPNSNAVSNLDLDVSLAASRSPKTQVALLESNQSQRMDFLGHRLSPPRPSPDFKKYTTDIISRPKFEQGAFTSPALEAGDWYAHELRNRVPSSGGNSLKMPSSTTATADASRRGSSETEVVNDSERSQQRGEQAGLINRTAFGAVNAGLGIFGSLKSEASSLVSSARGVVGNRGASGEGN